MSAGGSPASDGSSHRPGMIDRLYVLDGGDAVAPDRSVYSPGVDPGKPVALSCNAYLIRRAGDWILWDTGLDDSLMNTSGGKVIAHNIRGIVTRPLAGQLDEIGLTPADIKTVVLSHAHFDHVGNCHLFPHATWYVQEAEHRAMFGRDYKKHGYVPELYDTVKNGKIELVPGDCDLFADGSMRIFATPGHTPGHSSLLVRLPRTGPVMLSADVAHFKTNLDHRLVPTLNSDESQSRASMDKMEAIVRAEGALLWLNHDVAQNATIPHAAAFFD